MLIVARGNLSSPAIKDSCSWLERMKRPMVLCQVNFQVNPSTSDKERMLQSSAVKTKLINSWNTSQFMQFIGLWANKK